MQTLLPLTPTGELCDLEGNCVDAAEDEIFKLTTQVRGVGQGVEGCLFWVGGVPYGCVYEAAGTCAGVAGAVCCAVESRV